VGTVRIAIFDYHVTPTSPVGGCHVRMLQELCHEHEFTVFAVAFDNPCPERIGWVRVPAIARPIFLLFLTFYGVAPLLFLLRFIRTKQRFDVVQTVESYIGWSTVTYSHFCHRAYLRTFWKQSGATGIRGMVRWLDHALRSIVEPWTYRCAESVVVPSKGLADELTREYPYIRHSVRIIANPIDTERMICPPHFDAAAFRQSVGLTPDDTVLTFVALGHFERKGLPLLLAALRQIDRPDLKLLVVGGREDLISNYRRKVDALKLRERVVFVGMQRDTRPYLWASDGFIFPSSYEVFSLVCFEAAAAGLPLIVSTVYGVEEFLQDGVNGVVVQRTAEGVAQGIERFLALSAQERRAMSDCARHDVQHYRSANFGQAWREFYSSLEKEQLKGVCEPRAQSRLAPQVRGNDRNDASRTVSPGD
jgi:glycosyltransferase involved in cell wall biosynthesis